MLERAAHPVSEQRSAICRRSIAYDSRIIRNCAFENPAIAIIGVHDVEIEIDDRREIEIDAHRHQFFGLVRRMLFDCQPAFSRVFSGPNDIG